jgi:hypothetical protein
MQEIALVRTGRQQRHLQRLDLFGRQSFEQAQTSIAKKLQTKDSKERLAAGADDKAPPEYQKQVDAYFKAIAAKKKGS